MSVLLLYLLFATSVALLACYEIMWPALDIISRENPQDVLAQNKLLAYIAMFCVGWISAPVMIVCILNNTLRMHVLMGIVFKD